MKILVSILVVMLLSSCGGTVTQDMWATAERLCSKNGGVKYLIVMESMELRCNNGSFFSAVVFRNDMKRYLTKR